MTMSLETKARRAADRKREKHLNSLKSIAHKVILIGEDILSVQIDGVVVQGLEDNFNAAVERLGCRPVRITSNMLNSNSKKFAIDINTPSYCDPGCESYHSM